MGGSAVARHWRHRYLSYDGSGGVDLAVATIPEPGSAALLLASPSLLALRRRRARG